MKLPMRLSMSGVLPFLNGSRVARLLFPLIAGAALAAEPVANWPQFRGPGAMGVADNPHLPDRWSTNENVAWKVEVPGRGWSSPIVWGERVFLTTVVSEGEVEPPKKGLYFGGERQEIPKTTHRCWFCVSTSSPVASCGARKPTAARRRVHCT